MQKPATNKEEEKEEEAKGENKDHFCFSTILAILKIDIDGNSTCDSVRSTSVPDIIPVPCTRNLFLKLSPADLRQLLLSRDGSEVLKLGEKVDS